MALVGFSLKTLYLPLCVNEDPPTVLDWESGRYWGEICEVHISALDCTVEILGTYAERIQIEGLRRKGFERRVCGFREIFG